MTLQAHSMGLACRQFRAFDLEGLRDALGVQAGWHILTMTAIGRAAVPDGAPARERRSIDDLGTAGVRREVAGLEVEDSQALDASEPRDDRERVP